MKRAAKNYTKNVKTVSFEMLRQTRPYENNRASATVEVTTTPEAAFAEAKRQCAAALGVPAVSLKEAMEICRAAGYAILRDVHIDKDLPF